MKLSGLVPNVYIHVSGSDLYLYIPTIGLIWNICFPVLSERTLSSNAGGKRHQAEIDGSSLPSAHPYALAVEPRVYINDQHTNFQLGKLRIINGNN